MISSDVLPFADSKPLVPEDYPEAPGGTEQPWNYDYSLSYSKEWANRGNYRLLKLEDSSKQLDYQFVKQLCGLTGSGYEIEDIVLVSGQGDEKSFIAEVDLLQKKHGNFVHQAKWKPKNQREQQESLEVIEQRKLIRAKLKLRRYRAEYASNVKLLPLWYAFNAENIQHLNEINFNDLTFVENGDIGKGYYGKTSAVATYEEAEPDNHEIILMLSWYAGKVVYPIINDDEQKLKGQPHYANHDLHYRDRLGFDEAVVFDASQVLPRYLVSFKKIGAESAGIMNRLFSQTFHPSKASLLFKPNFSHIIATIAKNSFNTTQKWLEQQEFVDLPNKTEFSEIEVIKNFLEDKTKEVLLLTTPEENDPQVLAKFIEMFLWSDEQEDLVPLNLDLNLIKPQTGALVEQNLIDFGLSKKAIFDLKQYQSFAFVITGYQKNLHRLLIKDNYINSPNGFKGKIIVIIPKDGLTADENYYLYSGLGNLKQQTDRFVSYHLTINQSQLIWQIKQFLTLNNDKAVTPRELYFSKSQSSRLYSPGGDLKPWEYSNELNYSDDWQDKGGFKLHKVVKGDADYDFVTRIYQQSPMHDYELDEVYLISDQGAEQAFVANLNILERHGENAEYQGDWQEEGHLELRQAIITTLEQNSYTSLLSHNVKLLPLWHGTGPMAAAGIAKSGFASLALVDCGYFGKGLYGSSSAEYSYRVYARGFGANTEGKNEGYGDNGLLILGWYAGQNIFPVVKCDIEPCWQHPRDLEQDKLKGKANYKNYDSHFVQVKPGDRKQHELGLEDAYYPVTEGIEEAIYQEFVTFATGQILPRYILSLRDPLTKNRLPGMQAFLDNAEASFTTKNLYKKSILQTIAELKNSATIELEQDYLLFEGLSLYVPCYACNDEPNERTTEEEQYLLLDNARTLIASTSKDLWLLRGNSGSGKSLFGRYLEKLLWEEYCDGALIPLFVPLARIGNLTEVRDLITRALELKGLNFENILELKANKKFLFILDGYDELPNKTKLLQKYDFNQENGWQGKIIISFRTQSLDLGEELVLYPPYSYDTLYKVRQHLMRSYIIPFKPQQINQYIAGFCQSSFNVNNWQPIEYQNKIAEFNEIKELIKEPFLLFLVLNALPSFKAKQHGKIKKIDLYKAFTNNWFNNQFEKALQSVNVNCNRTEILTIFDEYAKDLAFAMFTYDVQKIRRPENSEADQTFAKFFNDDQKTALGFQGSPLKKLGDTYFFIHKSFQEYFVAKQILDKLHANNQQSLTICLQQRLIAELATLEFIASDLNEQLKSLLFNTIYQTKQNAELHIAAANAITILNTARVSFTNLDLSDISIIGANLTQGIFDGTNFTNSNLTAVNFAGSWLANTNFTNAQMQYVEFGEKASLIQKGAVEYCALSDNYFAVADWDEIKLYNQTFELQHTLTHKKVKSLALSPNNEWVASAGYDKLRIWLTSSGKELKFLDETNIASLSFSLDNKWLAVGCLGCIKLLTTTNFEIEETFYGISGNVTTLSFSVDNKWLLSGGDDKLVALWSIDSFKLVTMFTKHKAAVKGVTFSSCGRFIVACGLDKTINFWDINTLQLVKTFNFDSEIYSICFNPAKPQELAISFKNYLINLWDVDKNILIKQFVGHQGAVNQVLFSSDAKQLISVSEDKTIRRWAVDSLFKPAVYQHPSAIESLKTKLNPLTLVAKSNTTCSYWSFDGQFLGVESDFLDNSSPIVFNPSQELYAKSDKNVIYIYNQQHQLQKTLKGHNKDITAVAFINNNQLVSCSLDKSIKVWNTEGKNTFTLNLSAAITSIFYLNSNCCLITGSEDGYLYCWRLTDKLQLLWCNGQAVLRLHKANITKAVGLSYDNRELLNQQKSIGAPIIPINDNEPKLHIAAARGNLTLLQELPLETNINEKDSLEKTALFWATENGHERVVEYLLTHGAEVNAADKNGLTPLLIAAQNDHERVVEYLLTHGAEINAADKNGMTPLYIAAQNGHERVVEYLLTHGAKINAIDKNGITPLWMATLNGHERTIEYLLEYKAEVNVATNNGTTPLMVAALNGHEDVVEYLLAYKAEVNAANKNHGATPLLIAAQNGHERVVECLLTHGAKINAIDKNGITPLMTAVQNGHERVVECLLTHGAEINVADNDGATPLFMATLNDHERVVEYLLAYKAEVNVATNNGTTPLLIAAQNGHERVVECLLTHGVEVNAADKNGLTPLYVAARNGYECVVEYLLTHGAEVNVAAKASDNATPLCIAAANGHERVVECLLTHGAEVNAVNNNGTTPLLLAAINGYECVVEYLLTHGAEVNAASVVGITVGVTSLMVAAESGHLKVVECLLTHEAEVNAVNNDGITPLYVAASKGHERIVEYLLTQGAEVNAANNDGATPLLAAILNGHERVAGYLLTYKAEANTVANDGSTPLLAAAQLGLKRVVEYLLTHKTEVNAVNNNGTTSLLIAAQNGHECVVECLLTHGAEVNTADKNGLTPLYVATLNSHERVVEYLLTHGAEVNAVNKNGVTPLYVAALNGQECVVERLLAHGAEVNAADNNGVTPLMVATQNDHERVVEYLLMHGAEVNAAYKGVTPLCVAASKGHERVVEYLLKHGAEVNAANNDGVTPLMSAAENGHLEVVAALIVGGAAVNEINKDGCTSLHIATKSGHQKVVGHLIESKANVNIINNDGATPLIIAVMNYSLSFVENSLLNMLFSLFMPCANDSASSLSSDKLNFKFEIIKLLIESGAEVNAADNNGLTPLYVATQKGHERVVEYLLTHGAEVNVADKNGVTPLYVATQKSHERVVEYLLTHGAEVDAADNNGITSLYVATQKGHERVVEYLLTHGAEVDAADNNGVTPLMAAAFNGHERVVEYLLTHGAEVDAADNNGVTPLMVAAANGHLETVILLIENGAKVSRKTNKGNAAFSLSRERQPILKLIVHQKLYSLSEKLFPQHLSTQQLFITLIKEKASFEQLVDFIIENQGNLNENEQDQITLLMMATAMESYEVTKKLIIAGANKDATDGRATALHYACAYGSLQTLTLLLEQGCSLEIPDSTGDYPELWAVEKDNLEKLQIILEFKRNGKYLVDINRAQAGTGKKLNLLESAQHYQANRCIAYLQELILNRTQTQFAQLSLNNQEQISLLKAAESGDLEMISLLINSNAEVNMIDSKGRTPLHLATEKSHLEIISMLVLYGADTDIADNKGVTPLYMAVQQNNSEIVSALIDANAEIDKSNNQGLSPLFVAAQNDYLEVLSLLINAKAEVDKSNNYGETPLYIASKNGHYEIVRLLIVSGALIDKTNSEKESPLYIATKNGFLEIASFLINYGAKVSSYDFHYNCIFAIAIKHQNMLRTIVKQKLLNLSEQLFYTQQLQQVFVGLINSETNINLLINFVIDNKGNINATENDKVTLLMIAVVLDDFELTKKLLVSGAFKDSVDVKQTTALHYACAVASPKLLMFLIQQGCSLDITDYVGNYPELYALEQDNLENLQALLELTTQHIHLDINRIQGSTNKNLLESAKQLQATKCIIYLQKLILNKTETDISQKLLKISLESTIYNSGDATETSPILFSRQSQSAFISPRIKCQLENLLKHVAFGNQSEAEIMISQNPRLALLPADVTDCAGRSFKQITVLQYALWALDWHMWVMILKYISISDTKEQINALNQESWVNQHGTQVTWQNLIDALQQYTANYDSWEHEKLTDLLIKQIGSTQLLLPAHVINEYICPQRTFVPCPDYKSTNFLRTKIDDNWKTIVGGYQLGKHFAWIRGNKNITAVSDVVKLEEITADLYAIVELFKIRQEQFKQFLLDLDLAVTVQKLAIN